MKEGSLSPGFQQLPSFTLPFTSFPLSWFSATQWYEQVKAGSHVLLHKPKKGYLQLITTALLEESGNFSGSPR